MARALACRNVTLSPSTDTARASHRLPWSLLGSFFRRAGNRRLRRAQRELQRLARNTLDKRAHQPAQARGNVSRQRDGLALHVHALRGLLEAPVGIQAPQES